MPRRRSKSTDHGGLVGATSAQRAPPHLSAVTLAASQTLTTAQTMRGTDAKAARERAWCSRARRGQLATRTTCGAQLEHIAPGRRRRCVAPSPSGSTGAAGRSGDHGRGGTSTWAVGCSSKRGLSAAEEHAASPVLAAEEHKASSVGVRGSAQRLSDQGSTNKLWMMAAWCSNKFCFGFWQRDAQTNR